MNTALQTREGDTRADEIGSGLSVSVSVWIVDDHQILLDALCSLLRTSFTVTGQFSDPAVALTAFADAVATGTSPDFLLLDYNLCPGDPGGLTGLRLFAAMKKIDRKVKVVFVSGFPDSYLVTSALGAGAAGVLSKATPAQELSDVLRKWQDAVISGSAGPALALDRYTTPIALSGLHEAPPPILTRRQLEVLTLLGEGRSRGEIAELMCVSSSTIQTHTAALYRLLGTHGVVATVRAAKKVGLLPA